MYYIQESMNDLANNKHQFSLYWPQFSSYVASVMINQEIIIDDQLLCHRITRVLRLSAGEHIILFDQQSYGVLQLVKTSEKKSCHVILLEQHNNVVHKPHITCVLPMLKREGLTEAVYGLVEAGVSEIQLLHTEKQQRSWGGDKELMRLHNVTIAAAEQSKNFSFPSIRNPVSLQELIEMHSAQKKEKKINIFFDPQGTDCFSFVQQARMNKPTDLVFIIGPEGDLTFQEKTILRQYHIEFLTLTPTVLRAQQAAVCAAVLLRSLL